MEAFSRNKNGEIITINGLIRPFKGLVGGLIRPFKGLIRPFKVLVRLFKGLKAFPTQNNES